MPNQQAFAPVDIVDRSLDGLLPKHHLGWRFADFDSETYQLRLVGHAVVQGAHFCETVRCAPVRLKIGGYYLHDRSPPIPTPGTGPSLLTLSKFGEGVSELHFLFETSLRSTPFVVELFPCVGERLH